MLITCQRPNDRRERNDANVIVRGNQMLSLAMRKHRLQMYIRVQHIPAAHNNEAGVCASDQGEGRGERTARRLDELRC